MDKYTVRVHCLLVDEMVDVKVVADNFDDSFIAAETQHDDECGSSISPCHPEGFRSWEGWDYESVDD